MTQDEPHTSEIPEAKTKDSLRLTLFHILPGLLQGLFTRNRFWVKFFQTLHPDPLAVRFLSKLRRRYGAGGVLARLGRTPTLVLFDVDDVRHVLDKSPEIYIEPDAKMRGMSRFQPSAVTISHGNEWNIRRPFNESVLEFGEQHSLADRFAEIVAEEVARFTETAPSSLTWDDFEPLFERITLGCIFGKAARDDRYLTRTLTRLMRNANGSVVLPPRRRLLNDFQAAVRGYLRFPEENSLMWLCSQVPAPSGTRIVSQVPHWMFAMNETLALNCVRSLCLMSSNAEIENRIEAEIRNGGIDQPPSQRTTKMELVTGALQEAMRLWPTTPYLIRLTLKDDCIGGHEVKAGTQVLIVNGWFHRAPESYDEGDRFNPDFWQGGTVDFRFNHLSNGTQICAGKDLALFLGTEILARLLSENRFTLDKPHLNAGNKLPHAFNQYAVRMRRVSERQAS